MLFIPFVENAFKHGARGKHYPAIIVDLWILDHEIRYEVTNFLDPHHDQVKDAGKGIGLANVRRRLDLIYPEKHSLIITRDEEQYKVVLEITLL